MPQIFISYRRADSRTITGRIYDRLVYAFGEDSVFKDVDDIPLGSDFRDVIQGAVAKADVLLVIIGPQWVDIRDQMGGRRLENPDDFVRIEVEAGLRRDNGVIVVPVLVAGAPMPDERDLPESMRQLVYRNAAVIRDDPDFSHDISRLITQIQRDFPEPQKTPAGIPARGGRGVTPAGFGPSGGSNPLDWIWPGIFVVMGVIVLALVLALTNNGDENPGPENTPTGGAVLNPSPNPSEVLCTVINGLGNPIILRQGPAVTFDRVGSLEVNEVGLVIDQDLMETGKVWMLVYVPRPDAPIEGYLKASQITIQEGTGCPEALPSGAADPLLAGTPETAVPQ